MASTQKARTGARNCSKSGDDTAIINQGRTQQSRKGTRHWNVYQAKSLLFSLQQDARRVASQSLFALLQCLVLLQNLPDRFRSGHKKMCGKRKPVVNIFSTTKDFIIEKIKAHGTWVQASTETSVMLALCYDAENDQVFDALTDANVEFRDSA